MLWFLAFLSDKLRFKCAIFQLLFRFEFLSFFNFSVFILNGLEGPVVQAILWVAHTSTQRSSMLIEALFQGSFLSHSLFSLSDDSLMRHCILLFDVTVKPVVSVLLLTHYSVCQIEHVQHVIIIKLVLVDMNEGSLSPAMLLCKYSNRFRVDIRNGLDALNFGMIRWQVVHLARIEG